MFNSSRKGLNLPLWTTLSILAIIFIRYVSEFHAIPFAFEEFFFFKGEWWEPIWAVRYLFVFGFLINLLNMLLSVNPPEVHENASDIPVNGLLVSLNAGFMEEVVFRWIFLYAFMGIFWIVESLFNSEGLVFFKPISSEYLLDFGLWFLRGYEYSYDSVWTISLAMLLSSLIFSRGHLYQGWFGGVFSFIGAWVFFYLALQYGSFAAIFVHFLFDFMVFMMLYVDVLLEKMAGVHNPKGKIYSHYTPQNTFSIRRN